MGGFTISKPRQPEDEANEPIIWRKSANRNAANLLRYL